MKLITTLSRAAGLGLCVVAFSSTALADPGNGNGGPESTPPGQEQKAETPAATPPVTPAATPAPQAASGQEQKAAPKPASKSTAAKAAAPGQAKKAESKAKKAATKPAKVATPSKGQSANAHHHVIICHRTGSESNPYVVLNIPYTAWTHGHRTHPAKNGHSDRLLKDPASRPGSKDGFDKSACGAPGVSSPTQTQVSQSDTNTVVTSTSNRTSDTLSSSQALQATAAAPGAEVQAPAGGVAGAVSPTVKKPKSKSAGGVLGAIASAPAAVADTATAATLPFTGFPLWVVALIAVAVLVAGLMLRRRPTA